jgi:hypothetical protein
LLEMISLLASARRPEWRSNRAAGALLVGNFTSQQLEAVDVADVP